MPQNEEISKGGINGGEKRVGFANCRKRTFREGVNIKEREKLFIDMLIPT